ncbi:MAG: hypothetical protein ACODAE_09250 [Gemmatimonadota bacterium]
MTINRVSLSEAVRALGRAMVFAGDAFTADGLTALGATEGEVTAEEQETYNDLTLPEYTGEAIHERDVMHGSALVTVPLILGPRTDDSDDGSAVYDQIASVGDGSGGGYSTPQPIVTTNLLLIPQAEIDPDSGLSYDGVDWTPAAPVHAVWLWRAAPEAKSIAYRFEDGGKTIVEVPFRAFFDDSQPDGHKLWTRGDPVAAGIDVEV